MRAVVGAGIPTETGGCGYIIDEHAAVDRLVFGIDGKDSRKGGGGGGAVGVCTDWNRHQTSSGLIVALARWH